MAEKPKREKTRPPFFMVPSAVSSRRDLELADKLVFGVIVTRIGSNGHCWPGMRSLADDAGVAVSAVEKSIRRLETAGLLEVERQGSGRRNHYRLPTKSAPLRGTVSEGEQPQAPKSAPLRGTVSAPLRGTVSGKAHLSEVHEKNSKKRTDKITSMAAAPRRHTKNLATEQAAVLVARYGDIKKPSLDTSRTQAKANAKALLKPNGRGGEQYSFADLEKAVGNYGEWCELTDRAEQYRHNVGNFFGRKAVFKGFLPGAYQRPDVADAGDDGSSANMDRLQQPAEQREGVAV